MGGIMIWRYSTGFEVRTYFDGFLFLKIFEMIFIYINIYINYFGIKFTSRYYIFALYFRIELLIIIRVRRFS